jgi:hypothetical protein
MLRCVTTDVRASSFWGIPPRLTDFLRFICCGCLVRWQSCRRGIHFQRPGPGAVGSAANSRSSLYGIFEFIGANDEHFRQNHERDLWQQGHRHARWRRHDRVRWRRKHGVAAAPSSAPAAPAQSVDVAAIVDKAAAAKGEKLEWRTSIVDLMKALDIDSSFSARKELAKELGYTGDSNDSASMNIWLHKQVMAKLAANGGKLPPEIKH